MSQLLTYGGKTEQARTVIVYGNCQAPYVAQMLSALDDLNDDYRFVYAPNHGLPGEDAAPAVPDIDLRDVALVLMQYEEHDNPAFVALAARLPAGLPTVTFPSMLMNSFWPFECPEPRGTPDPAYPWKRYPCGDMIGLKIAESGIAGPLAVAAYLDLSVRKMPNLAVRLQRDIDRLYRYDRCCDVRIAEWVESNFRHQHLFWTSGHLAEVGVMELARRIAGAVRPVLGGTAQQADACLARTTGFQGMGGLQLPIHPVVAQALGLSFWQSDLTYRWYTQDWTFYEYIERYIAYDTSW